LSAIVGRIRHQFSDARPAKRAGLILLLLAAFTVVGTSAWAYWTTTGNGTASTTTGTLNPPTNVVAGNTPVSTTVHVSWTAPTSGAAPTGYYVTPSGGAATSSTCGTVSSPAPATSCDYTAITTAGAFTYTVTAVFHSWTAISSASNSVTVVTDMTPPTVTINQAVGQADPTNSGTVAFTAVFSEPVTGFTNGDVTVGGTAGGTKTAAITGTGAVYTVTISGATGNGTITASIGASTVQDLAGNNNTASTSTDNTVTLDTTAPTVTINQAVGQADPTNSGTVAFTAVFSESVTGFTNSDVTTGGTAAGSWSVGITGTGPSYTVTISGATGNGTITASIGASTVQDLAGNNNTASTSTDNSVTLDTTAPTVTINQAVGQADPTNSGTVAFTAVFSEPVTGFTNGDVTVGGTAGGTKTAAITGSGTSYTVTVSGATGNGTITASIGASTFLDLAGNANTASTSTDNTVTLDTTAPTVTLTSNPSSPNGTNGWFKSSVTWAPNGSDLSGIASCQIPVAYSSPDSMTASVTRTCTDIAGNIGTGTATFQYDGTAPAANVTSPANLASVVGTSVAVTSTNAADTTSGVASVQFQVKPAAGTFANIGAADNTSPYAATWDTTSVVNGSYLLQTVVTDAAGNTFTSGSTSVTVANVYAFVVSNPGPQTAGTAFGGGTLQLQVNGVNSATFAGAAYAGNKVIGFTGPSTSPSGTAPTYPLTVAFTDGLGTIGANAITLTTAQITTLTATMTADSIAGTSGTLTVGAGGATRLAWSNVTPGTGASAPGAAAPTPCLFTCTWSNFGTGSKTFTATVSVTDSFGNTVSGVGAGKSASVTGTGVTGGSLSLASVGPAVTSTQYTYTSPSSGANFTHVLTATGSPAGWLTATATITKN